MRQLLFENCRAQKDPQLVGDGGILLTVIHSGRKTPMIFMSVCKVEKLKNRGRCRDLYLLLILKIILTISNQMGKLFHNKISSYKESLK